MQFIDDAEFQIAIDLDQGGRISSLLWREMQIAIPVGGSLTGYGWNPIGPWGLSTTWREISTGRAITELTGAYKGATLEQRIEVLDDAIRWSLEYEPGNCTAPAWVGLNSWFIRDLDRGGSAEVDLNIKNFQLTGMPTITWDDVLQVDIESDAPWWDSNINDSEGISITPQTVKPGSKEAGDHYIECLFVFNGL